MRGEKRREEKCGGEGEGREVRGRRGKRSEGEKGREEK